MRVGATDAERAAWSSLRDRQGLGMKLRRQQVIDVVIADFCCAAVRLVVEIDGGVHDDPALRSVNERRTEVLRLRGLRVLRVGDVLDAMLVGRVDEFLRANSPAPAPRQARAGAGVEG